MAVLFARTKQIVVAAGNGQLAIEQADDDSPVPMASNCVQATEWLRAGRLARMVADVGELRKVQAFLLASGHIEL